MPYVALCKLFPELAIEETRTITILANNQYNVGSGSFGLFELYCNDKGCDCRRVFLDVISSVTKKTVAVIAYGWDSVDYYAKWFYSTSIKYSELNEKSQKTIREIKGPVLNASSKQSKYAPAILKIVTDLALSDESYVNRLKRHYKMFRAEVDKGYRKK